MAQRARQKLPGSPDIADTLGWIYIKKNLSDDAVRVFKELSKGPSQSVPSTITTAWRCCRRATGPRPSASWRRRCKDNPSKDEAGKIRDLLSQQLASVPPLR